MATITDIITAGLKNRYVRTEDFTATEWIQTGTLQFVANDTNTLDPLGTNLADRINDNDAGTVSAVRQTFFTLELVQNRLYTASFYLKPDTSTQTSILLQHFVTATPGDSVEARINWSTSPPTVTKVVSGTFDWTDVDIRASANGFYRVSCTSPWKAGSNTSLRASLQPASTSAATTGAVWAWGAQFERGAFATSYLAVTGATDGIPASPDTGQRYYSIESWYSVANADTGSNVRVGKLFDELYEVSANTLDFSRENTDITNKNTRLEPWAAGYDPASNVGPRIMVRFPATGGPNYLMKIRESFFELRGVALIGDAQNRLVSTSQSANGNEIQPVGNTLLWIDNTGTTRKGSDCVIRDTFASYERGYMSTLSGISHCYYIGSSVGDTTTDLTKKAIRNVFFNCIAKGGGPRSKQGAVNGWWWGNFAEASAVSGGCVVGGCYNCVAYGFVNNGRGFSGHSGTNRLEFSPELVNCVAVDCAVGVQFFWRHAQYFVSSDNFYPTQWNQIAASTGTESITDPLINRVGVPAASIFLNVQANDFRQRPGSPTQDAGLRLTNLFAGSGAAITFRTASGGTFTDPGNYTGMNTAGDGDDLYGNVRSTTAQTWDIGAVEGVTAPPAPAVNTVSRTVGRGVTRYYPSIGAAIADLPRSLYYTQQRFVFTCYGDALDEIGHTIELQHYNCVSTVSHYVEIKADSRINPRTAQGYTCQLAQQTDVNTYHRAVLWCSSNFFRMSGIMLKQAATSASSRDARVLELWADDCVIDGVFSVFDGTFNRSVSGCFDVGGDRNLITNCIWRGSNTAGQGAAVGLSLEDGAVGNNILHCIAFRIRGGTDNQVAGTIARGIYVKLATVASTTNRISGCVALGTQTSGTGGAADYGLPRIAAVTNSSGVNITGPGTITRTSGNWLTEGHAVGMLMRLTGWSNSANNADVTITAIAGGGTTTITVTGATLVTEAAGAGKQVQATHSTILDHSFAGDDSAPLVELGNVNDVVASAVFSNAVSNDFRLISSSAALNAGDRLGTLFGTDIEGKPRLGPFDVGVYEGLKSPPLLITPAPRDHHRIASIVEILRNDGLTHHFCSTPEPIEFQGQTYLPSGQTQDRTKRMDSALKEHNTEVLGAIAAAEITAEALEAGLYTNARITYRMVDWRFPWTTPFWTAIYYIAKVEYDQSFWRAELVGATHKLDQEMGELMGLDCENEFGDEYCQVNVKAITQTNISVGTVNDARREFTAPSMSGTGVSTNDYFGKGKVVWLSGANAGLTMEVKAYTGSTKTVRLLDKAPFDIVGGGTPDKFNLIPGCRLRFLLDCRDKYNNAINFGGRPFMQGPDLLFESPTR